MAGWPCARNSLRSAPWLQPWRTGMSGEFSSPTRRSVLAATCSSGCAWRRHLDIERYLRQCASRGSGARRCNPPLPNRLSGSDARRTAPAHQPRPTGRSGRRSRIDSQGVRLATVQALARYWATDYDWRKCEAKLNALPQFMTEIDGLDIHFIHVRSKHENALPMIVTHGWPGSIIEQLKIIEPLDQSDGAWRQRGGCLPPRHSVAAGLRLLRQADGARLESRQHRACLGDADAAPRLHDATWRRAAIGGTPSRR